jgi:hypothetical protein
MLATLPTNPHFSVQSQQDPLRSNHFRNHKQVAMSHLLNPSSLAMATFHAHLNLCRLVERLFNLLLQPTKS